MSAPPDDTSELQSRRLKLAVELAETVRAGDIQARFAAAGGMSVRARKGDLMVSLALEVFRQRRDIAPLIAEQEKGNPAIMNHPEAREILSNAARSIPVKGKGKVKTSSTIFEEHDICAAIAWLNHQRIPVKNDPDLSNKMSACRMVAQYMSKECGRSRGEGAINSIWLKYHDTHKVGSTIFTPWGKDRIPTPDEVLEFFLSQYRREGKG